MLPALDRPVMVADECERPELGDGLFGDCTLEAAAVQEQQR